MPDTDRMHLVRHGEVHNPDHLVYADLPGFGLSERGRRQAAITAGWLARHPVALIVSSPLQRAVETAAVIAAPHGLAVERAADLIEWQLLSRWAGHPWGEIDRRFPGELGAYLADPSSLPFASETLDEVGARVAHRAAAAWQRRGRGHVVIVAHQDPIEAGRRRLTGRSLAGFHTGKPDHGAAITLAPAERAWREIEIFTPPQA